AMIGLFIGGIFTDRLYSEAPFWMGGLAVVLHRLNEDRLAKAREAAEGAPSSTGTRPASDLHPAAARIEAAHAGTTSTRCAGLHASFRPTPASRIPSRSNG